MTAVRHINAAGLEIVKRNESCRLDAYQDAVGVYTIGYGHCPAISGTRITQEHADELLWSDLDRFESAVCEATASVPTSANQFSAMVSLAFNIGAGAFRGSTVVRKHRLGDFVGAAEAFLLFDKGHEHGQFVVLPGLLRRRKEEAALYLSNGSTSAIVKRNPKTTGALAKPARTPSHRSADPDHSANDLNLAELERLRRGR